MSASREIVEDMLVRAFALTMHLAAESRDADGNICCCVCGGDHGLTLTARGWGGVYACRACTAASKADEP